MTNPTIYAYECNDDRGEFIVISDTGIDFEDSICLTDEESRSEIDRRRAHYGPKTLVETRNEREENPFYSCMWK